MIGFGIGALAMAAPLTFLGGRRAAGEGARPTVVELFTSQGCSSCPPADALLGKLAERDDVIALAYHIDYWNYIGWTDPFSSPESTDRQRAYGHALGLRTIYTPQMVIDGRFDVVGSRTHQVHTTLDVVRHQVTDRIDIPVALSAAAQGALDIRVSGGVAPREAAILLVAYDRKHETRVPLGENAGRTLVDHNVVRGQWLLGTWTGEPWSRRVDLDTVPVAADSFAVLVQAEDHGPIYGAAAISVR